MREYKLGFISDEDIFKHVKETVSKYRYHIDLNSFNSNIIDPIKLTFDSKIYNQTLKQTIENECIRQIDKTNSNNIGYFHQNIFKYAKNGWTVPHNGEDDSFDVTNHERHIFCEVKNKHNTMNSSSSQKTYIRMQNKILRDDKATCYLVEVIAKHSQDIVWSNRVDGHNYSHERIRRISMDKFYDFVFGQKNAFFRLCQRLPDIIDDVINEATLEKNTNTVFEELNEISPDTLKGLYLLAFRTYEGFDEL
ncbi:MAG: Eco47II family restriction endonuclease [Treponema sp.]|nr:Eco47II family restriction endonuclease [Treponema sp.]